MDNGIVYKTVALTVFVMIAATVLLPVVDDVTKGAISTEFNPEPDYLVADMSGAEELTFTISGVNMVVNGENVPRPNFSVVIAGEKVLFTAGSASSTNFSYILPDGSTGQASKVVWNGGNITYTVGGVDNTISDVGDIYYISNEGQYGLFKYNQSFNISDDETALLVGFRPFIADQNPPGGIFVSEYENGAVTNLFGYVYNSSSSSLESVTSMTWTLGDTDNDVNWGIDGVGLAVVNGAENLDYTNFTVVIAPMEFDYLTPNDSTQINLIKIIPLLVIVAAIVFAVNAIPRR